ncbi:N,N-dimethylformamidase beta subunit family domain-containing protein [Mesorhizobium sp. M0129]|uniref:N,N-dimethylformamidase beta subunit family domain-containing protein n=1 Tax=Mesorhizobium sp. M0129 TaxID=2956886 RepID=UPI003338C865
MKKKSEKNQEPRTAAESWPFKIISASGAAWNSSWVEVPDRYGLPAAWCYSNKISYSPGEPVNLFISSTVPKLDIAIQKDGLIPVRLTSWTGVSVDFQKIAAQSYMNGCGWQETISLELPEDVAAGAYILEMRDPSRESNEPALGHHIFFVRSNKGRSDKTVLLVASTCTWAAYNDWGGASHYIGLHPGYPDGFSPILSSQRPWARGQVWLPSAAPRNVPKTRPRRPEQPYWGSKEWAFANGYSRCYASAGWATYERPFLRWAEQAGYDVHVIAQEDLELNPEYVEAYPCMAFVGHCEYWSAPMRRTVDAFVDRGGKVARFAGNFFWQIRLREGGPGQVCYKSQARDHDPVRHENPELMTSLWEDPMIGYPGAQTFGVNGTRGIYAATFGIAQRSTRGFNVFRHKHWSLEGTGLGYADTFGDEASIFAYEVDGLDYTFVDGLPVPTGKGGTPEGLEIVAMNWASNSEYGLPEHSYQLERGDTEARFIASILETTPGPSVETADKYSRGSGMMVSFKRGSGEVFCAATCEWVRGLIESDFYTDRITRNVLDRFLLSD